MQYNYTEIAKFWMNTILPGVNFLNPNPVKDPDLLYNPFYDLIQQLNEKAMNELGYGFKLTETYRSNTLQAAYYSQGLSKIKSNGMHHYGIACDTIFVRNGATTYKGDFAKLHTLYESLGGPDLGSLEVWDAGHFQFIPVSEQNELRAYVSEAIETFQRDFGLKVDGIAGPITYNRAIEVIKTGTVIEP